MKTEVANMRLIRFNPDTDVRIDRGTIYGNPFRLVFEKDRDKVIDKYEVYARKNKKIMSNLYKLVGKRLLCWCAPKRCHGDVLIKLMKEMDLIQ